MEDSDKETDNEEDVVVGGVVHKFGKRTRIADEAVQDEGTDLKVGDTVEVGSMTWIRIAGLPETYA